MSSPIQAQRASAFKSSIGVNTHLNDNNNLYGNIPAVFSELQYLGVGAIRDNTPDTWTLSDYEALAADGIKEDLVVGYPGGEQSNGMLQTSLGIIAQIQATTPGSISGLEGLNEPYNFTNTWNGQLVNNWSTLLQVQQAEYAAIKTVPSLANVPILNASVDPNSFSGASPNFEPYAELANAHVYPYGGGQPTFVINSITLGENQIMPGDPQWITEFGYSSSYQDPSQYGVSQSVQATDEVNGLLDALKDGIPMTFLYELNNEVTNPSVSSFDDGLGLFSYTGVATPAAIAIHDMATILNDTGSSANTFTTGSMNYTLTGMPSTGNSLLLEKSNGSYDIVIWNEAVNWNPSTESNVAVAPVNVTLNLGATYQTVQIFDPIKGSTPISTFSSMGSVQLSVGTDPLIIQVVPTPTPTPTVTPNDTVVLASSTAAITDTNGNAWTITSGAQIAVNGTVDAVTSNLVELAYVKGEIWQLNTSGNWYGETQPNDAWGTPTTTSPLPRPASSNGTMITSAMASPIIDSAGNAWTLVRSASNGLQIAVNGVVDAVTSNAVMLETLGGKMEQENTSGNWYSEAGPSGPWTQITAPTIQVSSVATGATVTINGATVGTKSVAGEGTFVLTAPGAATMTLGSTAIKISFLGMSSVAVTGSSGAVTIMSDGGTNTFTGGTGIETITGGAGADSYIYHARDGLMMVTDFSFAKRDSLTVDTALKGSITEKSDGNGGLVISFGSTSHGVDLVGVSSITASQIHFV